MEKGKLKIFFGISPGVGKTFAMLRTAHAESDKGVRVAIGWVEERTRSESGALLKRLLVVPQKRLEHQGIYYEEPDIETILNMRPQLALIADLAHDNAPGSRNRKRYQDIQELLDNGIDVYTTANVICLESRIEAVSRITGFRFTRTLPDEIFELADEVELIDITPKKLLTRLNDGKVNLTGFSEEDIDNFFLKKKITALRKMSFRIMTDRLNNRKYFQEPWKDPVRMLIWIDIDPVSIQVIERVKIMADLMDAEWTALYVETDRMLTEQEKKHLVNNVKLVHQCGGDLITFLSNDPVGACLEIVQRENISHIVIPKPAHRYFLGYSGRRRINRLIRRSGDINIYMIGVEKTAEHPRIRKHSFPTIKSEYGTYAIALLVAVIVGLLSVTLAEKTGYRFLPLVVLLALFIMAAILRIGPILIVSTLLVFALADFLIPPLFSFELHVPEDIFPFVVYFGIAFVIGFFTIKFREQKEQAEAREQQTNALFLLTKRLSDATDIQELIKISEENIQKYFSINACFIFRNGDEYLTDQTYIPKEILLSETELEAVDWAFKNEKIVGKFTDNMPFCAYTYYPLKGSSMLVGVVALKQKEPFTGRTSLFWDAFLTQITQSIEHRHLEQLARQTSLLNESARLYKTLFNSISHELRIPVATIMGASDILMMDNYPDHVRQELYGEMVKASQRLNRLIENLLNMSRLESGHIAVHPDWCDVFDLFNRVKENLQEELQSFRLVIAVPESMPLVKLDFGLMEQVIYNLVYNSSLYAVPGTTICIKARYKENQLVIQVMDRGSLGFEPKDLPHVFDKFWRYKSSTTGGLGLGLSIVKGFVEAHKGTVTVRNRRVSGVCFTITIPTEISNGNSHDINPLEEDSV